MTNGKVRIMSADRGEPDPQEWPTYPGLPDDSAQPQPRLPPTGPPPSPYAQPDQYRQPDPAADQAYPPYHDYAHGHPDLRHEQLQPYQQAPYQQRPRDNGAAWLQNKWMWIIGGILAVFVITGLVQGNFPWVAVIFGVVVWNILRHKRRQG